MSSNPALPNASALAQIPATSPPPGVRVDFNGPNPLSYTITTVASVFVVLTLLFLGIRTYAKVRIHRHWTWDDVTCGIGLITTLVYWVICILLVENEGFGRHLWDIPLSVLISEDFLKLSYISSWLNIMANSFIKLTLFILYWSIFYPFRWLRYGILGGAAVVTGVYAACIMYVLISDAPRPGHTWLEQAQVELERGTNGGVRLALTLAVWGLVTDIYILLLPVSGVMRLQLSRTKRIALLTVFMTGIGACICSSLSIYYRVGLKYQDLSYTAVKIQALVIVELCVGIMITCVPTTSVFLRHILQPQGLLRSASSSIFERLRSHLTFTQQSSSQGNDANKGKSNESDGPYRHLKERGFAVNEDGVYNLKPYTDLRTETTITAQPSQECFKDGIHVHTDLEQA